MNIYDTNCAILSARYPHLVSLLENADTAAYAVETAKSGQAVPLWTGSDGKKSAVHSRYEPVKEAERFLAEVFRSDYNLYVVAGFGFAYHIELLLSRMPNDSVLLVMDHDVALLKLAMEHRDLGAVFSDPRFLYAHDPSDDEIATVLRGRSSKSVSIISHRGCYQTAPDYYLNLVRKAKSYLSTKEVNIATLAKFEKLWTLNCVKNMGQFASLPGANIFYDKFRDYDAVVVCAGPSLEDDLVWLRRVSHNVVVVGVDTSYRVLSRAGIEPHFCLCVDPQVINARYFEGMRPTKSVLVADPTVHASVFRFFKGRSVICSMPFDMMKWAEEITGEKGELTHGGSVSTNACDFAKRLGVRRVILLGQDLSFTKDRAHVKGSYLDELLHNSSTRFLNRQMQNRRQVRALPPLMMPSLSGAKVATNQKMMIFYQWFERRMDDSLINASSDGLVFSTIPHVSKDSIVFEKRSHGEIDAQINVLLSDYEADDEHVRRIRNRAELLFNEASVLGEKLEKALLLTAQLKSERSEKKRAMLIKKLEDIDAYVQSASSAKSMVGLSVQRVIHTITEGYDAAGDNVLDRSAYLYSGLLEGAVFVSKALRKLTAILGTRQFPD